jgi:ubiquinone biosynthesis protein COQ4
MSNPSKAQAPTLRKPTSAQRRAMLKNGMDAANILLKDPSRLDQVLVVIETVNAFIMRDRVTRYLDDPAWQRLFETRPLIDGKHVDYGWLATLPKGTLGREYVEFLRRSGITPNAFATGPDVGDERINYVILRHRQTHDIWHVAAGYPKTDVEHELLLLAFTYAQTGGPGAIVLSLAGSLKYARTPGHAKRLWLAYKRGREARSLGPFDWESHWQTPVTEVRKMLGLDEVPEALPPARDAAAA